MHIELIGCTSAGKSTLAGNVLAACRQQGVEILLGDEFVLRQWHLQWVRSRPVRSLLVNGVGLLASLLTWRKNRALYRFAALVLFRLSIPRVERLQLLRNVLKKLGVYEIIRRRSSNRQVILVDEGTLQIAHNLFVHASAAVDPALIPEFAAIVPLPDVVVYLRQPEELLVERIVERGHSRLPDRSDAQVTRFVRQAIAVFDQLVQQPAVAARVLITVGEDSRIEAALRGDGLMLGRLAEVVGSGFLWAG